MNRERALDLLVSLRAMADHPNTPPHEAEAARLKILELCAKYEITPPKTRGQRTRDVFHDAMAKVRREQARARAAERARRAEAQFLWEQQNKMRDAMGREYLTAEELEWARRDPLSFAASRDTRTQAERQRDMQNSWGQPHQR